MMARKKDSFCFVATSLNLIIPMFSRKKDQKVRLQVKISPHIWQYIERKHTHSQMNTDTISGNNRPKTCTKQRLRQLSSHNRVKKMNTCRYNIWKWSTLLPAEAFILRISILSNHSHYILFLIFSNKSSHKSRLSDPSFRNLKRHRLPQ